MPPIPEGLQPLRWRWIQFLTRRLPVRFLYWPPSHPTGYRNLRMFDQEGYNIGRLVWQVCDSCQIGSINKISIDPDRHRLGLGRRLIRRALADGPDYRWQTSGQSPMAQQFFPALEKETGVVLTQYGGVCNHISSGTGYQSGRATRSPRPVLERDV